MGQQFIARSVPVSRELTARFEIVKERLGSESSITYGFYIVNTAGNKKSHRHKKTTRRWFGLVLVISLN